MSERKRGRPAVDREFRASMSNLRKWTVETYLAGDIEQCTYNLATQILGMMCEQGSRKISFAMQDTWGTTILREGTCVATSGPDFTMYEMHVHGALQECQRKLGLVTGRNEAELQDALSRAGHDSTYYHFTELAGDQRTGDWNYVKENTELVCEFDEDVLRKRWIRVTAEAAHPDNTFYLLPNWLGTVEI